MVLCSLLGAVAPLQGPALAAQTTLESRSSAGVEANQHSFSPTLSADGRYLVFTSGASNLVAGDTNGYLDIFLRDRANGSTARVSVGVGGTQANGYSDIPVIAAQGRHVAFFSEASNLVDGDTNAHGDIFVHDRELDETTRVSVASDGTQANADSYWASISANGRFVAFHSEATNLVPADENGSADVFLHDRETLTTTRVSVGVGGAESNGYSAGAAISADGRFVAFESSASNLVAGDTNGGWDVFLYDRVTETVSRVSVSSDGEEGNGDSYWPSISADGRFVAFESIASNLVGEDTNERWDIFVHDRHTGATTRASVASGGAEANGGSYGAVLSADGRFVAFESSASNLVPGDSNEANDVFRHDRQTGATLRVSVGQVGNEANGESSWAAMSGDGRYVAFESLASNLLASDGGTHQSIFLHGPLVPWLVPADFNADGRSDLLWRHPTDGRNAVWLLSGNTLQANAYLPTVGSGWAVVARGDFDGDGKADLLWREAASGRNAVWLMNGTAIKNSGYLPTVAGTGWAVVAAGDYDGDGKADLVWRDSATGRNAVWLLNGTGLKSSGNLPGVAGTSWAVVASGDFDGDGKSDLLWREAASGRNAVWLLTGSALKGSGYLPDVGGTWSVVASGDYDGDGQADLVWRDSATGRNAVWLLNGSSLKSSGNLPGVTGTAWAVVAGGDYDRDGKGDLLWREAASGRNALWYLNGTALRGSAYLPNVAAPWIPVPTGVAVR